MNSKIGNTFAFFLMYWILFGIGLYFGQFIPSSVASVISVVIVITMLATLIFRIGVPTFILPFLATGLGVASYYFFHFFVSTKGMDYVMSIVILAILMFITAGMLGLFFLKNITGWGKYLTIALIALIVMSLVSIFLPIGGLAKWLAFIGLILFLLYTMYDFNRIRHDQYEPAEMGFALFINLLNIIEDLLVLMRNA